MPEKWCVRAWVFYSLEAEGRKIEVEYVQTFIAVS